MATFVKFNSFVEALAEKKHDLGADTLKVMLTLTAPTASNVAKSELVEIAAGNGYTAGGNVATLVSSAQTAGTYKLTLADPATWTASGGAIANFQYAVLYNTVATGFELIGFWAYPSVVTVLTGETFKADLDQTNGVLTIA